MHPRPESSPPVGPRLEPRRITDPHDMRALAHPIRLALLEVLGIHGALTATRAGELIGESPASCSFHLRTLARHDFVEETGDGQGRQRPWRLVALGTMLDVAGEEGEGDATIAADGLSRMFVERQLGRLRQWWARRAEAPPEWRRAAQHTEHGLWLTPTELEGVNRDVLAVFERYRTRLVDPGLRPDGAELVEVLYFSYPWGPLDGAPAAGP